MNPTQKKTHGNGRSFFWSWYPGLNGKPKPLGSQDTPERIDPVMPKNITSRVRVMNKKSPSLPNCQTEPGRTKGFDVPGEGQWCLTGMTQSEVGSRECGGGAGIAEPCPQQSKATPIRAYAEPPQVCKSVEGCLREPTWQQAPTRSA